ncbi:M30 family zinc metallopeptidase [Cupriavidus oxalaticus]|uniref:M30 family zinc metallopeptidase n=1 Tax=Cupriavidus oxalaticus TaxID=96344 RepID=UPI00317847D6
MPRIADGVHLPVNLLAAIVAAALLAGCGGGGGDEASSTPPAATTGSSAAPLLVTGLDPACTGCGAASGSAYAGSGTGIWQQRNTTGADIDVRFALGGLAGQSLSLMLTNTSGGSTTLSSFQPAVLADTVSGLSTRALASVSAPAAAGAADAEATRREIADFNRSGWAERAAAAGQQRSVMSAPAPQPALLSDTRGWYHTDKTTRTASLVRQATTSDGVTVNVWVEDEEYAPNRVQLPLVDALAETFAGAAGKPGVYDMLKSVGGPLWGPHNFGSTLIAGSGQPIDIVILNFDRNSRPFGMVGYFWGLHNLRRSVEANSNESVSLYLDAETLYLGGDAGLQAMKMVMAHEGMHMQNFYRRGVLMGPSYAFQDWLEEMTAMMMEDFASYAIDSSFNNIRDVRMPDYVRTNSSNCNLFQFTGFGQSCESYSVSGSFGGFLNRQLGLAFFRDLLARNGSTVSKTVLEEAIASAQPGTTLADLMRRWAVSANALLPSTGLPAGYGYPARSEGGFTLPAIDLQAYVPLRPAPAPQSTLAAYGSYLVRTGAVSGTYTNTVRVPAGAVLSVVAY